MEAVQQCVSESSWLKIGSVVYMTCVSEETDCSMVNMASFLSVRWREGHISLQNKLDERRVVLVLDSTHNINRLENLHTPVWIKVKSACDISVSNFKIKLNIFFIFHAYQNPKCCIHTM